jgi:hypothetical protein
MMNEREAGVIMILASLVALGLNVPYAGWVLGFGIFIAVLG